MPCKGFVNLNIMYEALICYTCLALTGRFSCVPYPFLEAVVLCFSGHVVLFNPIPWNNWPLFTGNWDDPQTLNNALWGRLYKTPKQDFCAGKNVFVNRMTTVTDKQNGNKPNPHYKVNILFSKQYLQSALQHKWMNFVQEIHILTKQNLNIKIKKIKHTLSDHENTHL